MQSRTLFSLIGDRYLDTEHDQEYIDRLESELKRRNIVGIKRVLCEYLAASSLWWNILWWDWEDLDGNDVRFGWSQNLIVFGVIGLLIGLFGSWNLAFIVIIAIHLFTLKIGLSLRKGTKPNKNTKRDC
jgi:hypothetical protein